MNEQDRYRGNAGQRQSAGRDASWDRDDQDSLLDRGNYAGGRGPAPDYGNRGGFERHSDHEPRRFSQQDDRYFPERGQDARPYRNQGDQRSNDYRSGMGDHDYRSGMGDHDYRSGMSGDEYRPGMSGYGQGSRHQQTWSGIGSPNRNGEPSRQDDQPRGPSEMPWGQGGSFRENRGSFGPSYRRDDSQHSITNFGTRTREEAGYYSGSGARGFYGRGPKGYTRSDTRICEDVCERLSENDEVDATDIEVSVTNREVTLSGTVETRRMKHLAEDIADSVSGVEDVHNRIGVRRPLLKEVADKLLGDEPAQHHANSGTKNMASSTTSSPLGSSGTSQGANGRA